MKLKNKIYTLLSVFTLVGLTHSLTLKDLNAALTAPASYDINYQYNSSLSRFVIGSTSLGTIAPLYTLTADGAYNNYSATLTSSSNSGGILPEGLDITMTYNRSNTSWQGVGPTPFQLWRPNDTKIGSNSSVGVIIDKVKLIFDNQTSKDYYLYLDLTTTNNTIVYEIKYNTNNYSALYDRVLLYTNVGSFIKWVIPSFSQLTLGHESTDIPSYFDAWYLKDLGVSASYDAGYDAGYDIGEADGYEDGLGNNPNILLSGFQAMVGILVNFMLMIINLEVFGVSILSVFSILALFVGVIWILKIIRG